MDWRPSEDISQLCQEAGIEPEAYRTFPTGHNGTTAATANLAEVRRREAVQPKISERDRGAAGIEVNWSILSKSFESPAKGTNGNGRKQMHGGPSKVGFFGAAGGVGTTTIIATLARLLSQRSENVVVVDQSAHSLVPFYFGCSGAGGASEVVIEPGGGVGQVRLSPKLVAPSERHMPDRYLTDCGKWDEFSRMEFDPKMLHVVVLAPDVASVDAAGRFRKLLFERGGQAAGHPVRFLLNRFDSGNKVHVLLQEWLCTHLGETMLPFAIRKDEGIPSALLEGRTIFTDGQTPGAGEDFLTLVDWITNYSAC